MPSKGSSSSGSGSSSYTPYEVNNSGTNSQVRHHLLRILAFQTDFMRRATATTTVLNPVVTPTITAIPVRFHEFVLKN